MKKEYLYRYMSFYSFVDMVQQKKICLVKPDLWEDTYENYFFKSMRKREFQEEYIKFLKMKNCKNIPQYLINIIFGEGNYYMQSWTKLKESDAMWRIYGYSNFAIKIEVELKKVRAFDNLSISQVKYKDIFCFDEFIKALFPYGNCTICSPANTLIYKRQAFQHEEEVRLIKSIINPQGVYNYLNKKFSNLDDICKEIKNSAHYNDSFFKKICELYWGIDNLKNELPDTFDLPISQKIEDFIESVTLHPLAPEWFNRTLDDFCYINGKIRYKGKSKLYEII